MEDQQKDAKQMNLETALATERDNPGFFREKWQQLRLVFRLLADPEVPIFLKAIPFISIVYFLLPVDVLPDALIGLGQLDDLGVLLVGAKFFIDLAPAHLVARHMDDIRAEDGYGSGEDEVSDKIIIESDHEVLPK